MPGPRHLAFLVTLFATPAYAQLRDFCPERPGLDTPPCIVDAGHWQVEIGLADLTRDRTAQQRSATIMLGETELRYGLDSNTEIRAAWTAYGWQREAGRLSGNRSHVSGTGDLGIGFKRALLNPSGDALSIAAVAMLTLPTGSQNVSDGTWSAAFQLPLSYALTDSISLIATPEIDAAADQDGAGRHVAYGSAGGLSADLSDQWNASVEMQILRDRDPGEISTQALGSLSVAFKPQPALMLDAGANFGLNQATPDTEIYIGLSRRF